MHLLRLPATIGDFPAIYRVLNDITDQCRIKQRILPVVSGNLTDPMVLQIFCKTVRTDIRGDPLFKNSTDRKGFLFIDLQYAVLKTVAVRREAPVPFAVPGFLDTALHGLDTDILTLYFCHCRQN